MEGTAALIRGHIGTLHLQFVESGPCYHSMALPEVADGETAFSYDG
jgi:hypothetical protein